jgi:lipoprotein-anchoring transpeptidase ErfK/SrfK
MRRLFGFGPAALLAASALSACSVESKNDVPNTDGTVPAASAQPAPPAMPTAPDMQIEVDLGARELRVMKGGQVVATHPVAVGSKDWPTPTGEWTIGQVVFNPRWVPPKDESWAKDEKIAEPGAPDNPLGRAQLVYSPPNTIHGTTDTQSLGKAASHGSIRVANDVVVQLARQVMEAGGAQKDEAFFQQVQSNAKERVDVDIPNPIPIRIVEGAQAGAN